MPFDLSKFAGAIGQTASGNEYIISKIGKSGLHVVFVTNEPTDEDKKEVNKFITSSFNVDIVEYNAKGATSKERKEDELNAYNKFLRKNKDHS